MKSQLCSNKRLWRHQESVLLVFRRDRDIVKEGHGEECSCSAKNVAACFWNGLVKTWKDWLQLLALTVVLNHSETHRFLSLQHWRIYQPVVQTLAKQNHLPFYAVRHPRKIFLLKLIFKQQSSTQPLTLVFFFNILCCEHLLLPSSHL